MLHENRVRFQTNVSTSTINSKLCGRANELSLLLFCVGVRSSTIYKFVSSVHIQTELIIQVILYTTNKEESFFLVTVLLLFASLSNVK